VAITLVNVAGFFFCDSGDPPAMVQASWMRNSVDVQTTDTTSGDVSNNFQTLAGIANEFPACSAAGAGFAADGFRFEVENR
jgi:hypothetical protein